MNRIESFKVNHDLLEPGVYISRVDGDITTFDMRFVKPNTPPFLPNPVMHTIEHLFATYSRNSRYSDKIVYFGPMGCRTGFYFLTRSLSDGYSINLIKEAFQYIADFWGMIPGATMKECGNCSDHNLAQAKEEAKAFLEVIQNWTKDDLKYPE